VSTFADSSALVKLYADEPGNEAIRRLAPVVVSCLVRVEVPAAIWRKHRMRELSQADARLLIEDFEADYFGADRGGPRFLVMAIVPLVLDAAATLVAAVACGRMTASNSPVPARLARQIHRAERSPVPIARFAPQRWPRGSRSCRESPLATAARAVVAVRPVPLQTHTPRVSSQLEPLVV
jgi:hypothetical protein